MPSSPGTFILDDQAKASLQILLDALPFYVLLLDANHRILLANHATTSALRLPTRPFPGCPFEAAVKTGTSVITEFFDPRLQLWLEMAVHPTSFRTEGGQAVYFHSAQSVQDKKLNEIAIQRNLEVQGVLLALSQLALENYPLTELLDRALLLLLSIPWLTLESRGCIFLADSETQTLDLAVASGLNEFVQASCAKVPYGRCLCGRAAQTQNLVFADHLTDEHETRYAGITPHGHYCVPMVFAGETIGVINTYIKDGHAFDKTEDAFLRLFANALAGIIVRKRTEGQLERTLENLRQISDGMVHAIAGIVEHRDPYTAGHQRRTARLSCAIAARLGWPKDRIEGLRMAGLIHDIGKIYIPAEILSKPGKLTEPEFAMVKSHAQVGFDILKDIQFPWPIAQIVYQHHEKLNGSGYPRGLNGAAILPEARIIAVADVVEAISSHRPYRPAIGLDHALEEIEGKAGVLYDPAIVAACLSLFRERGFSLDASEQ
jgi:putative nucleotidyltransferase with HDIG domain